VLRIPSRKIVTDCLVADAKFPGDLPQRSAVSTELCGLGHPLVPDGHPSLFQPPAVRAEGPAAEPVKVSYRGLVMDPEPPRDFPQR
jgi:hypothetical protein